MKSLFEIFKSHKGNEIYKWEHYFDIYEKHFSKFRNLDRPIIVVEIGILNGGSLQMWKEYFGANAIIYGIDIYEECKKFEEDNIKVLIGSQADSAFLSNLLLELPKIDVLIDDGSHRVNHQIFTFEKLFHHINDGGVYLVEDTHSSYWSDYGGGLRRIGTFVEFAKKLIDQLNARYSEQLFFNPNYYTSNISGIYFYDSIVCFDKKSNLEPKTLKSGKVVEDRVSMYVNLKRNIFFKVARVILLYVNKILQFLRLPAIILGGSTK